MGLGAAQVQALLIKYQTFGFLKNLVCFFFVCLFVFVFLPFLGPFPWHMEVPRLGGESEL